MEFIKTANGRVDNTPKHSFYTSVGTDKQDNPVYKIKWSKSYREVSQRYQFKIPKNLLTGDILIKFDDNEGLSFNQVKVKNLVPHIISKYPNTNNFGLEEIDDNLFKVVPLEPRIFPTPSEETITKLTNASKAYRDAKVEQNMIDNEAYEVDDTNTQTV